jgi:hypothetical protein
MGAVAWAMRQHAVSHPRSSNRTCRSPASGSPTGFTVRHTTGQLGAGVRDAADRVLHRRLHKRIGECRVLPPCVVWRGSRARAHRRIGQHCGMRIGASRGRSSSTSPAETCSAYRALQDMDRDCQPPRQTGNLPAGGLVGAALIHGTAFFGQPPISRGSGRVCSSPRARRRGDQGATRS